MNHLDSFFVKFQLESLSIKYTTDADAAEKLREETRPGAPHITFSVKPFVRVVLENPIPRSGLFTANVTISEGDNMKTFHEKVGKAIQVKGSYIFMILSIILGLILIFRFILELSPLKIYRYDDPLLGPRKIPTFNDYKTGKTILPKQGNLFIDSEKRQLFLGASDKKGSKINIGSSFVYILE